MDVWLNEETEERVVYTAVLIPDVYDRLGDIVSEEHIRKFAHGFMDFGKFDNEHDKKLLTGLTVVENHILNEEKFVLIEGKVEYLPKGTWVIGIKVSDDLLWKNIVEGSYTGVSITALHNNRRDDYVVKSERRLFKDVGYDYFIPILSLTSKPAVDLAKFFDFDRGGETMENYWEKFRSVLKSTFDEELEKTEEEEYREEDEKVEYLTKDDLEGFATKEDVLALSSTLEEVQAYLKEIKEVEKNEDEEGVEKSEGEEEEKEEEKEDSTYEVLKSLGDRMEKLEGLLEGESRVLDKEDVEKSVDDLSFEEREKAYLKR